MAESADMGLCKLVLLLGLGDCPLRLVIDIEVFGVGVRRDWGLHGSEFLCIRKFSYGRYHQ